MLTPGVCIPHVARAKPRVTCECRSPYMRGVTAITDFPRMSSPSICDTAACYDVRTHSHVGQRRPARGAGGKPDLDQDVALLNRAISGGRARGHEALDHERPMRRIIDAKRNAHPTLRGPGMRGSACACAGGSCAGARCRAAPARGRERTLSFCAIACWICIRCLSSGCAAQVIGNSKQSQHTVSRRTPRECSQPTPPCAKGAHTHAGGRGAVVARLPTRRIAALRRFAHL
jgi:hypothetical protein